MRLIVYALLFFFAVSFVDGTDACSQQPAPTNSNVAYGPDERNVLDFWKADGESPRPLLIYIHGGGWLTGDKSKKGPALEPFLMKGVSFAAINYRLTPEHPLPAPVYDAARAIQFLRTKASLWNIDKKRIALKTYNSVRIRSYSY